jgi:two-component system sensor histidine kinase QseC
MKLLNKTLLYLSVSLFFIIGLWSFIFYFKIRAEIKGSVDEGLDNYKRQIVYQAQKDTNVLAKKKFDEGFFAVRKITQSQALSLKDRHIDSLMYMQDADDKRPELEPVRLLTTAFENNGNYYELRIINSIVEEDDLIKELIYEVIWLYLLLIISLVTINNILLKSLWKPFYSFLNQLKSYRVGSSKNFPEAKTKTKEFADLQIAVNILLQHNIETYEQQKQFIGNASHELQTPLAIAINKLELLIENGNLRNEQAASIAEIMSIIERLVRLNKALLLLTKIENKQFLVNKNVSLNKIITQSVNDLEEIAAFKNVKITVIQKAELTSKMDISLANIIISNLLRNAIFHNVSNGEVAIEVAENTIQIINTGSGNPLDVDKIFLRFYKSNNDKNSTGLGLTIVKAICDLYSFSLLYHFENDLHSFTIRL